MPVKTKTSMLKLRIEPEQLADVTAAADKAGLTLTAYVRRLLREGRALERRVEAVDRYGAGWTKHEAA
jgi:predicted HicB family RNase H-like nuclease